jgi:hypothetical protein
MAKIVKGALKFIAWLVVGLISLVFAIFIALYLPPVQRWIAGEATDYLSERTKTRFEVSRVGLSLPFGVKVHGIFIEDQQHDTLLAGSELEVDIDPIALFDKRIVLTTISANSLTAHIERSLPDSSFNFDFIAKAFAGDTSAVKNTPKDSASAWTLSIGEVDIHSVYFTYNDQVAGTDAVVMIGDLNTELAAFDTERMKFKVDHLFLTNTFASVVQRKKSPPKETKEGSTLELLLGDIELDNVKVDYNDRAGGQRYLSDIKSALIKGDRINVLEEHVSFDKIYIDGSRTYISLGYTEPVDSLAAEVKEEGTAKDKAEWKVKVNDLDIKRNTLRYYKYGTGPLPDSIVDPNRLLLTGVNLRIRDFNMKGEQLTANITHVSARDRSGFELKQLATKLTFGPKGIELASLDLRTKNSRVGNYIKLTYPSIDAISKSPGKLGVNANFSNTSIAVSDVLMLDTAMARIPALTGNRRAKLTLGGKVKGRLEDFVVTDLKASTGYAAHVHVNGSVRGLPNADTVLFDLKVGKLTASARDIRSFVPDTLLPSSIELPPLVSLSGHFKGTLREFNAEAEMSSSFGNGSFVLHMDTAAGMTNYSGTAELRKFNIGKLLEQEKTMGAVTGNVLFEGSGLTLDSMQAIAKASIMEATINGYTYHNLNMFAHLVDKNIKTEGTIRDTSIAFVLNGNIDLRNDQPAIDMVLFLEGANLKAINVTKDDIRVQGMVEADLAGTNIDSLNGKIALRNVILVKEERRYVADSLVVTAVNEGSSTHLRIESPIVSGELKGQVKVTGIAGALTRHFDSYLKDTVMEAGDSIVSLQRFDFHLDVKDPSIISEIFIPELKISPGSVSGSFHSNAKKLSITGGFPRIAYGSNQADSIKLSIDSDKDKLSYSVSLAEVLGASFRIGSSAFTGDMQDGKMASRLSIKGDDNTGHDLLVAGVTTFESDAYRFHTDSVVLNDQRWEVPEDNYMSFGKQGVVFHNVRWQNGDSYIAVNSTGKNVINIAMSEFDLGQVAGIIAIDKPVVGGVASGTAVITTGGKQPVFNADLDIKEFSYMSDTIGAVTLKADNERSDRYNIDMRIRERGNDIDVAGFFRPGEGENTMDLDLDARKINLATFRGFSMGQLRDVSGTAAATLKVTGEPDDPDVEGMLVFEDVLFRPSYLNSAFTVKNENVRIEKSGIYFSSFLLTDSLGNKARMSGAIFTSNFRDMQFDLEINTKEFLALNTSEKDNKLYYGKLLVNSRIRIQGSDTKPEIDILAKLVEGSSITFVVPEDVLAEVEREGIVEFVDFNQDLSPILTSGFVKEDAEVKPMVDIDLTANVEIDEGSEFRIVVDPRTGDSLYIRGTSTFSFGIDPSGKITLIGAYDITEGSYQLSFGNVVRKRFFIQRGSRISWSGDPIAAQVDITAEHRVRTSPLDLVSDQVNLSQEDREDLRQQMQFLVMLKMDGRLLTPKIDFDIDLPPDQRDALNGTVYARLLQLNEQESELNQQVFALIILNRFLPQNPLNSTGGNAQTAAATAVRSSTSKLLTQQLNEFTSNYINLVDITLGLDSYQDHIEGQAQGRTNLQVDVRKEAFNDRLRFDMGGNVELEGTGNNRNGTNSKASDVSVEYKLTKDGRYRLRGLRRTGYVGVFEGRLTETGVGLIFVRDYNRFSELFARPREEETYKDIKE